MGINTKSIQSFAVTTAFWLNVAVAAVYIASAYAGYADPRSCGYLSLLVLAFVAAGLTLRQRAQRAQ